MQDMQPQTQDGSESLKRKREVKAELKSASESMKKVDKDGAAFYEITDTRRVSVKKYLGSTRVDIREFFIGKDGQPQPGKRGISL